MVILCGFSFNEHYFETLEAINIYIYIRVQGRTGEKDNTGAMTILEVLRRIVRVCVAMFLA